MSILIGADIVPTKGNLGLFIEGRKKELLGNELVDILDSASFRVFNLEVPLTDFVTPIKKEGPNLRAPEKSSEGFKAIGADLLALANNHILDQGEQGLASTIKVLDSIGINHIGAGANLEEADKAYFFQDGNIKYGIYACAEHEFSIANESSPGANPFDPLETPDRISEIESDCDYLIVLYHGGKEHYRYPSPDLQKTCRKLVEKGADLVVCQHSHCIGCKEEYLTGQIIYGQGNFLFDHQDNEFWNTSLLLRVSREAIDYIPLIKNGSCVRLAIGDDSKRILSEFEQRSRDIQKSEFVHQQYRDFAQKSIDGYLLFLTGISGNLIFRAINKLSGHRLQKLILKSYSSRIKTGLRNYIECEAHRELLLKGLEGQY